MLNVSWILSNIKIPGNIGFSARILTNFGFSDLRLVNCVNHLHEQAINYSANCENILHKATIYQNINDALYDRNLIIGTTTRSRDRLQILKPIKFIHSQEFINLASYNNLAILFGCETSGLTNSELNNCNYLITIPTSSDKSSINISHALGIVAYEVSQLAIKGQIHLSNINENHDLALINDINYYKNQLFDFLAEIGFVKTNQKNSLLKSISSMLNKTNLNKQELAILRAMLGKMKNKFHFLQNKIKTQ